MRFRPRAAVRAGGTGARPVQRHRGRPAASFDILPALKREDSNVGQRAGRTSPLATSRLPDGVRRGDTGFVRDTSAPRRGWRVRRPFGHGIRLHRASRSSRRDGGDAPGRRFPRVRARAVPSACLPFVWFERPTVSRHHERRHASFERPRWAGTIGRGSLFACRVATASVTPSRGRVGGLRRPGGPQSNRQFLPVVLAPRYAVRMLNSGGCRPIVGFIPAVHGGAFSSILRNVRSVLEGVRAGAARVVTPGRSPGPSERNVFISTLCIRIHERWPSGRRVERRR